MHTGIVAQRRKDRRLVEDRPVPDTVAESGRHDARVIGEVAGQITVWPAAFVFQRLRKVPVIERGKWTNLRLQESVHKAAVVVEPLPARPACTNRLDARPTEGKAITVEAHLPHQGNVLVVSVVRVARHVSSDGSLDVA